MGNSHGCVGDSSVLMFSRIRCITASIINWGKKEEPLVKVKFEIQAQIIRFSVTLEAKKETPPPGSRSNP